MPLSHQFRCAKAFPRLQVKEGKKPTRDISFQSKEEQKSKLWQYKAK